VATGDNDMVLFRVEIGRRNKADPKWLLPMLCRRGKVTRDDIGNIRILDSVTEVEIAGGAAEQFAMNVRRTDGDDIRINPIEAGEHAGTVRPRPEKPRFKRDKSDGAAFEAPAGDGPRKPRPHDDRPRDGDRQFKAKPYGAKPYGAKAPAEASSTGPAFAGKERRRESDRAAPTERFERPARPRSERDGAEQGERPVRPWAGHAKPQGNRDDAGAPARAPAFKKPSYKGSGAGEPGKGYGSKPPGGKGPGGKTPGGFKKRKRED
jgi:ATP-dependent RNA helicase DeaD